MTNQNDMENKELLTEIKFFLRGTKIKFFFFLKGETKIKLKNDRVILHAFLLLLHIN